MFFPTPAITAAYAELVNMFAAQGFKKHVIVTRSCNEINFIAPIVEEWKRTHYGEGNYYCVNPRNDTCNEIAEAEGTGDLCLRPFVKVLSQSYISTIIILRRRSLKK